MSKGGLWPAEIMLMSMSLDFPHFQCRLGVSAPEGMEKMVLWRGAAVWISRVAQEMVFFSTQLADA
jgi:hypothetical protein